MLTLCNNILSATYDPPLIINFTFAGCRYPKTNHRAQDLRSGAQVKTIAAETGLFKQENIQDYGTGRGKFLAGKAYDLKEKRSNITIF